MALGGRWCGGGPAEISFRGFRFLGAGTSEDREILALSLASFEFLRYRQRGFRIPKTIKLALRSIEL